MAVLQCEHNSNSIANLIDQNDREITFDSDFFNEEVGYSSYQLLI